MSPRLHNRGGCVAGLLRQKRIAIPEDGFRFRDTLHLPSIMVGSETNYRFAGVFHALNQRRARLCHSKQTIAQFPKLDVAGSTPVSRSNFFNHLHKSHSHCAPFKINALLSYWKNEAIWLISVLRLTMRPPPCPTALFIKYLRAFVRSMTASG